MVIDANANMQFHRSE